MAFNHNGSKVLSLVFSSSDGINPPYHTKCGTFTNRVVKNDESELNQHRIANQLKNNCLQSELKMLIGWCLDDGTLPFNDIPLHLIKPINARSWARAIKQTAHNVKEHSNG